MQQVRSFRTLAPHTASTALSGGGRSVVVSGDPTITATTTTSGASAGQETDSGCAVASDLTAAVGGLVASLVIVVIGAIVFVRRESGAEIGLQPSALIPTPTPHPDTVGLGRGSCWPRAPSLLSTSSPACMHAAGCRT